MIITQIVKVTLHPEAADLLPYSTYKRAEDWFPQWTPENNFQAFLTETAEEGVELAKQEMATRLVPAWLKADPSMFQFEVNQQVVKGGRFWYKPGYGVCSTHDIPSPTKKVSL